MRTAPVRPSLEAMPDRLCAKAGCGREALATLTYDYGDRMAVLGPLGQAHAAGAHDLCAIHADRVSAPQDWLVVRHETLQR